MTPGLVFGLAPNSRTPDSEISEYTVLENYDVPELVESAANYFSQMPPERYVQFFEIMQPDLKLSVSYGGTPTFKDKKEEISFIKTQAKSFAAILGNDNYVTLEGILKYRSLQCAGCSMLNAKYFEAAGYEVYWFHVTENKDFISESHASILLKMKHGDYFLVDTAMGAYEEVSIDNRVMEKVKAGVKIPIFLDQGQTLNTLHYRLSDNSDQCLNFSEIEAAKKNKKLASAHRRGFLMKPHDGMTFALLSELASKLYTQLKSPLYQSVQQRPGVNLLLVLNLYRKASEIFPDDPYLISGIAFLKFRIPSERKKIQDWNKVLDVLKEQMNAFPGNTKLRMNTATYYIFTKNNEYARKLIEEVLQYDPGDYEALINYTMIFTLLLNITKTSGMEAEHNLKTAGTYFGYLSRGIRHLARNKSKAREVKSIKDTLKIVMDEFFVHYPAEYKKLKLIHDRYMNTTPQSWLKRLAALFPYSA